jgi:ubiquitin carboxyl-terminal hydrolase 36/42
LEINQVDNLEDALKSFTKVEQIGDSEEKLTCEHCKAKVCKNKQLILDKAPDVLAFQLKRFTTIDNSIEKIDKHVAYPLELDLKPFHSNPDTMVSSSIPSACLEVGSCSRNFRLTI